MKMVLYSEHGLPELDIPPDAFIVWYPFERRYSVHLERGYDHGVLLNQFESGRLEDVTPSSSSGDLQLRRRAVAALAASAPAPSRPAPTPQPPEPLKLVK
jgi:hypothetical protein